ncbi:MAG: MIP/aquaporin family protein [Cytophagales bacterium]|nr:MIP/aquaporin family protein [Cytophagales bacterium]
MNGINIFLSEFVGMTVLITLGCGVVAAVNLDKTYAKGSGWLTIAIGWGVAAFFGSLASLAMGSGILNPAVVIALIVGGEIPLADLPWYIAGEFAGAMIGATVVYIHYMPHFKATTDPDMIRGVFCNAPAIRNFKTAFVSEFIASFFLIILALAVSKQVTDISYRPVFIGLVVLSIGLSLGSTTGYAINPARDLGPRIAHYLLPIHNKSHSDWAYSWVPVLAPILGCMAGYLIFSLI